MTTLIPQDNKPFEFSRRKFLAGIGITGAGAFLASCGLDSSESSTSTSPSKIAFDSEEVERAEAARPSSGNVVEMSLIAATRDFAVGGQTVSAKSYGSGPVGPEIRASVGDELKVDHVNDLDEDTIIHWHGIQIRNDMDGAPPLTGDVVSAGETLPYSFKLPHPGTYWYHSHVGVQADEAMLGALIVEDPEDPYGADSDHVIVLDDWVQGFGASPDELLAALNPALGGHGAHSGHGSSTVTTLAAANDEAAAMVAGPYVTSDVLGGMVQHINYPEHLINGKTAAETEDISVAPQSLVRLRFINAAAETPYRVAIGGKTMRVIETDGFPCAPLETTSFLIGMAQRMDVLVEVDSGSWPIVAQAEGTTRYVATELRTEDSAERASLREVSGMLELSQTPTMDADLKASDVSKLAEKTPDRSFQLELIQSPDDYIWGISGPDVGKIFMKEGERIRIEMTNSTEMWHPMHLHGHTFAVPQYGGLRRDTVNILPGETLAIEFDADNPGAWMFHCHNAYHLDAGMTTNFYYEK